MKRFASPPGPRGRRLPGLIVILAVSAFPWRASLAARPGPPSSAVVVYVVDGDSLEARFPDGTVGGVRLIGVDAPEMTDEREQVRYQAFLAKRFASHHLSGKTVSLEYDWNQRDIHGRLLAYVRPPDGALFNLRAVREGFAYAFLRFPFRKDFQEAFRQAQRDARRLGRGIWRKEPPPAIGLEEARKRGGAYVSLKFRCSAVRRGRQNAYLSSGDGLEVVISGACGLDPGRYADSLGRELIVRGIIEKEGRLVRVQVCFSRQVQVLTDSGQESLFRRPSRAASCSSRPTATSRRVSSRTTCRAGLSRRSASNIQSV